ncbi:YsnF/AvaK domain-containing protein [Paracoccus laeviglucosivorans]|nr:DUF2382 domain-containing protein [Paracoccus laeviglucosivorans]
MKKSDKARDKAMEKARKALRKAILPEGQVVAAADLPLSDVALAQGEALLIENEAVMRLLEEELEVGRRVVETGRLRLHRRTQERVEEVAEELVHLDMAVEHVPVGEIVEARPQIRETDDEIIIPVVEEIIVVERKLMLKEEIRIRKQRHVEQHREQVTLRRHVAEVLRLPPKES